MPDHEQMRIARHDGHPLWGSLSDIRNDRLAFFERLGHLGDVVRFRVGPVPLVLVSHPALVQHMFVDNVGNYVKDARGHRVVRSLIGRGLLTAEGPSWLRQRRISQPAFHRRRIASFADTMVRCIAEMLDGWEEAAARGEGLDIAREMMRVTLRIVSRTMLSHDARSEADEVGDALAVVLAELDDRVQSPWGLPEGIPTPGNLRLRRGKSTLDRVVRGIIAERRAAERRGGSTGDDLLAMLMEARDPDSGEALDDELLRDEVMGMFIAGHETTAVALSWTLHLLALHAPEAEALRREVDAVLGGRPPGPADLPALDLARRILDESMRLYPPGWIMSRRPVADDVIGGCPVTPRDTVFVSPFVTHRRPDLWPDPTRFDPRRFLPEAAQGRHRFAWFPFGGGRRKCIGEGFALMETRFVLAMIAQRFRLELAPGHRVVPQPQLTLRPRFSVPMMVIRR